MHGHENSLSCARESRKSDNLRMHTEILDLTMQKVSQDILMIIWHKSYHILYLKNERKIMLRWQWNSVNVLKDNQIIHMSRDM